MTIDLPRSMTIRPFSFDISRPRQQFAVLRNLTRERRSGKALPNLERSQALGSRLELWGSRRFAGRPQTADHGEQRETTREEHGEKEERRATPAVEEVADGEKRRPDRGAACDPA